MLVGYQTSQFISYQHHKTNFTTVFLTFTTLFSRVNKYTFMYLGV
jgi:hypothetical protein